MSISLPFKIAAIYQLQFKLDFVHHIESSLPASISYFHLHLIAFRPLLISYQRNEPSSPTFALKMLYKRTHTIGIQLKLKSIVVLCLVLNLGGNVLGAPIPMHPWEFGVLGWHNTPIYSETGQVGRDLASESSCIYT